MHEGQRENNTEAEERGARLGRLRCGSYMRMPTRNLCRCLCRNPPIPAGIGPCRSVSLRHRAGAANVRQTRIKTVLSVSLNLIPARVVFVRPGKWHGRGRRFEPDQVHQFSWMPAVYILQSESTKRFYIGCAAHVLSRLAEHQRGQTISTRGRGPWVLVHQEQFATLREARLREKQLKSWKSHRSIQELIDAQLRK